MAKSKDPLPAVFEQRTGFRLIPPPEGAGELKGMTFWPLKGAVVVCFENGVYMFRSEKWDKVLSHFSLGNR